MCLGLPWRLQEGEAQVCMKPSGRGVMGPLQVTQNLWVVSHCRMLRPLHSDSVSPSSAHMPRAERPSMKAWGGPPAVAACARAHAASACASLQAAANKCAPR